MITTINLKQGHTVSVVLGEGQLRKDVVFTGQIAPMELRNFTKKKVKFVAAAMPEYPMHI